MRRSDTSRPKATLERESAIFLDDLGAIEQARRWSRDDEVLVLEVEARRGDTMFRARSFVAGRWFVRGSAEWKVAVDAPVGASVDRFMTGLVVRGRA